jgi:hypothetical protein
MKFIAVFAFVLLAGCANPYADFYHPSANVTTAMKAYIPSSAALAIYTTNDFPKDVDALVRRGYLPVGNSSFNANSNSVNEDQLRSQASAVHAQVVLLALHQYGHRSGSLNVAANLDYIRFGIVRYCHGHDLWDRNHNDAVLDPEIRLRGCVFHQDSTASWHHRGTTR